MLTSATVSDPCTDVQQAGRPLRALRYEARSHLWDLSGIKNIRKCGRVSIRQGGEAAVRITDSDTGRRAGFAGLASCGSVWACPVCSAKIAAVRQQEIEQACAFWEAQGGALAFGSFTVGHRLGQSLKAVWDAVGAGWHGVTSGRAWIRNQSTYGIEGWLRVVEVTYTENGWHVHIHTILFLHHGLGAVERAHLSAALLGRWQAGIGKHGFSASARRGVDIRMAHGRDAASVLSDYFTKGVYAPDGSAPAELAAEVAGGIFKRGRSAGSRTPFRILEDFLETGDLEDLETWREWERRSKGRRQSAWSKGLRDLVRLCRERTDEEIAGEEVGTALDDSVILPAETVQAVRFVQADVLAAAESPGVLGAHLRQWLDARGLRYFEPGDLTRTATAPPRAPRLRRRT